ncbi:MULTISPECIES: cytochrome P450 [Streptomyces]|uniref:Cytochrome P450 n=1 Tax=Streptomyces melanosporofaciens TaxID=67327 RepID=A0A1H5B3V4_STRMJ|nr:cytochrome P450 [Streptomyces melanosporofaciens]SED49057.1 Cytochrome P450 [Streptomyces melanosporofaciens]
MTNPQDDQDTQAPHPTSDAPPPGCPAHAARLYGPDFRRRPAETYQRIRHESGQVAPVLLEGDIDAWFVLGYRETRQVLSDVETFGRDPRRWNGWDSVPPDWPLLPWVAYSPMMTFTEGEEHRQRATAVGEALATIDPFVLRGHCERFADQLIDKFAASGKADLVYDYIYSVPTLATAELFGLSDEEAGLEALAGGLTVSFLSNEEAIAGQQHVAAYVAELVKAKRDAPGPDLTSQFILNTPDLTEEQQTADLMVLMAAALPLTSYWIGNTLRLMLTDERFAMTLSGNRRSIGEAMNEVLWADSPLQNLIGRYATRDTALGGRRIRTGDLVVLGLAAANADPLLWPDTPVGHGGNHAHVSFSGGDYGCPAGGPETARIIAETAIEVLLDRVPDLTLAVAPEELRWVDSFWYRCLESLPVTFSPTAVNAG